MIGLFCLLVAGWLVLPTIETWAHFAIEWLTAQVTTRVITPLNTSALRTAFRTVETVKAPTVSDHTHGNAAGARTAAKTTLDMMAVLTGRTPIWIQASQADLAKGRRHSTRWFWAKDVAVPQEVQRPQEAVYILSDVDYYVDMPAFLARAYPNPVLLYTFAPTTAAGKSQDVTFHFNLKGELVTEVSGGGKYVHQLWDWNTDNIAVTRTLGTYYYHVERRQEGSRAFILLAPQAYIRAPWSYKFALEATELKRFNPMCGKHVAIRERVGDSTIISLAKPNTLMHVELPEEHFQSLVSAARLATLPIMTHTVAVELTRADVRDAATKAPLVTEVVREIVEKDANLSTVYPAKVNHYEMLSGLDCPAKPSMAAFMSPIAPLGFAPVISIPNERWCIISRVLEPARDAGSFHSLPHKYAVYALEFIEFLVPEPFVGHPVEYEEVVHRQSRPSQRAILEQAEQEVDSDKPCKNMLKKQAEGKLTPARNIATLPGAEKRNYSEYMYSFAEVLKLHSWYAFAKTPVEVANRIATTAQRSKVMDMTDADRLDARHSRALRLVETMAYVRHFAVEHHEPLLAQVAKQSNKRCVGELGTHFTVDDQRLTGSGETSIANTIDNAFIAYSGMRDSGEGPQDAWVHMEEKGNYGGDDGATGDVAEGAIPKAGAALGMKMKSELVQRGSLGVNFLARYYGPGVWEGDPNSCTDPRRAIGKFHLTTASSTASPLQKFLDKAYALELSDPETPIIRDLVRRAKHEREVANLAPTCDALSYLQRAADGSALEQPLQYPNRLEDWMHELLERQCPGIDALALHDWSFGDGPWDHPPLVWLPPSPPAPADVPVRLNESTVPELSEVDLKAVAKRDDEYLANPTKAELPPTPPDTPVPNPPPPHPLLPRPVLNLPPPVKPAAKSPPAAKPPKPKAPPRAHEATAAAAAKAISDALATLVSVRKGPGKGKEKKKKGVVTRDGVVVPEIAPPRGGASSPAEGSKGE